MKETDRFLVGIVVGVLLLVVVALVVVALRPLPTYKDENTPEGVAHDYLLALQRQDYARAYGCLSPTLKGYPSSADAFMASVRSNSWAFSVDDESVGLAVQSVRPVSADIADVIVEETRSSGSNVWSRGTYASTFRMEVRRQDGTWKITHSERYWAWCWDQTDGCK